jgi:hypothetical protein
MLYVETPARNLRSRLPPHIRQLLGRLLVMWTAISIIGGLVFFFGGFLTVRP